MRCLVFVWTLSIEWILNLYEHACQHAPHAVMVSQIIWLLLKHYTVTVVVILSDFMLTQCGRAFTDWTWQKVLVWDVAVRCTQCYAVERCCFWEFAYHVNLASKQGQFEIIWHQRRGERFNLLPQVKQRSEWQDSIHCKWKTAMKSRQGWLARAVKTLYIWCSSLLLKVDLYLAFKWQQVVSKPNLVCPDFQIGQMFSLLTIKDPLKTVCLVINQPRNIQ